MIPQQLIDNFWFARQELEKTIDALFKKIIGEYNQKRKRNKKYPKIITYSFELKPDFIKQENVMVYFSITPTMSYHENISQETIDRSSDFLKKIIKKYGN